MSIGEGMPGELLPPNLNATSASPFGCTICGHRVLEAHGPDETCFDCDEQAQVGQYAPCADPALDEDAIYEAQRQHLLEMLEEAGVDDDIDELPVDLNPEGDPTRNGAFG